VKLTFYSIIFLFQFFIQGSPLHDMILFGKYTCCCCFFLFFYQCSVFIGPIHWSSSYDYFPHFLNLRKQHFIVHTSVFEEIHLFAESFKKKTV